MNLNFVFNIFVCLKILYLFDNEKTLQISQKIAKKCKFPQKRLGLCKIFVISKIFSRYNILYEK